MTKIGKTDEEWQQQLTSTQFQICRKKGTERPFTGEYWSTKRDGVYHCVCCGVALFDSATKYNSGSGWPSFYQPIDAERISEQTDSSLGMSRTEVMCADCGSHLGHVFPDGPEPTGLRYCINSASLNFAENKATDQHK